ncbi:GNAT family N-acetyltransferase [Halosegnis marinus]|uniref:GNAT family N-acetyltransferase n=1 Tax=Halosegnis marinus TaxID=3034023 RepID=A0ABD5ZK98_9EURY|nr:GNAT family N-acetyltransferase [Halosegnis sp. DT85]
MDVAVFDRDDPDFEPALALRTRVFVEEQDVPMDREVDGLDPEATHFLLRDPDPVAVARVRDHEGDLKVERVAVARERRGEGYGDAVMDAVESWARENGYDRLVLDAQVPVVGFYEGRGYTVQDDEPFDDAGIPHRRMATRLG